MAGRVLRLALFMVAVLLLFRAGTLEAPGPRQDSPAPGAAGDDPRAEAMTERRIAARRPKGLAPVGLPDDGTAPAAGPFDLSQSTAAEPAGLSAAARPARRFWQVTARRLAVRAGPSVLYAEIASLGRGDLVSGIDSAEAGWLWLRNDAGGIVGFATAADLAPWPLPDR